MADLWFELTIRYLGIAAFSMIVIAAAVAIGIAVVAAVMMFTPRLHRGRPQNDGELRFYDRRAIATGKDGDPVEGSQRLLSAPLKIRWWLGLSPRKGARWWAGFIRFEPNADS